RDPAPASLGVRARCSAGARAPGLERCRRAWHQRVNRPSGNRRRLLLPPPLATSSRHPSLRRRPCLAPTPSSSRRLAAVRWAVVPYAVVRCAVLPRGPSTGPALFRPRHVSTDPETSQRAIRGGDDRDP